MIRYCPLSPCENKPPFLYGNPGGETRPVIRYLFVVMTTVPYPLVEIRLHVCMYGNPGDITRPVRTFAFVVMTTVPYPLVEMSP